MNTKRSYKEDLSCRFCSEEAEETQEHLESCEGTSHERRKLNIELQGPLGRQWYESQAVTAAGGGKEEKEEGEK